MLFAGFDIGTTSINGVIYDSSTGSEKATISVAHNAYLSHTTEKIQSIDKILESFEYVKERILRYENIEGIGITGQMHGILYIDKDIKPLSDLYTWENHKAAGFYKDNQRYLDIITDRTGLKIPAGYGLATHFTNLLSGETPKEPYKICTISNYIASYLCGSKQVFIDSTEASGLGFYDVVNRCFYEDKLQKLNIPMEILPEYIDEPSIIGQYNYNNSSIPVYLSLGDNQAGFMGVVKEVQKQLYISLGTSGQVSLFTNDYVEIPNIEIRPFPFGGYIATGAILCGGRAIDILANFFEETLKLFGFEYDGNIYELITKFNSSEKKDNIRVDTRFKGSRIEGLEEEILGSITKISTDNFTPENLIKGFYKGVAEELFTLYKLFPENSKLEILSIEASGNTINKSSCFKNLLEKTFSLGVELNTYKEPSAIGAAKYAYLAK